MRYSIERLKGDVMARLGEIARPQGVDDTSGVPWPEDIVGMKAAARLGEVGSRIIVGAPVESLGGGIAMDSEAVLRKMPCGLNVADVRLPDGFLRLVSVKMAGWRQSVSEVFGPDSSEWGCRWSAEAGIAGCPERPRAYLDSDGEGPLLRLMGSTDASDSLDWLVVWCVPEPDDDGEFEFPSRLYGELVEAIAGRL